MVSRIGTRGVGQESERGKKELEKTRGKRRARNRRGAFTAKHVVPYWTGKFI